MKSEHRHELKSNELADWLGNLPQWCKDNLNSILIIIAIIVVVAGFFGWRFYSKNIVQSGQMETFTNIVDNLLNAKAEIVNQQMSGQGSDISYILLRQSTEINKFAAGTGSNDIAAFALIKGADAIRSELHYRPATITKDELSDQINKAKTGYTQAIAKSPSNKTVKALALFGLGLCSEELGDFNDARKTYNSIAADPNYEGTILVSKAKLRLYTMDEYKSEIVFKPAPPKPVPDANAVLDPLIRQIRESRKAGEANLPDANVSALINELPLPAEANRVAGIKSPNDINKP